jgi:hypothetical protein
MNPWTGLVLTLRGPGGVEEAFNIIRVGESTYSVIKYQPNATGQYLLILEGYDEKYVRVRQHNVVPILEDVPEEVKSLFFPLLFFLVFVYLLRRRRTKTVIDDGSLKRFSQDDELLEKLIEKYGKLYASTDAKEGRASYKGIRFIEFTDADKAAAENLSEKYGITPEAAKTLRLAEKLRAKHLLTSAELPDEIRENYRGTKIGRPTLRTLNHKLTE